MAKTIAILHPGEMGAATGACLAARGCRLVWASESRSAATRARAAAAGFEDAGSLERALAAAEIAFSICPPSEALALAREVARRGYRGRYVDCNAISPASARDIGRIVESAGATFVDGGIVGPPPRAGGRGTRLFLSGSAAGEIAELFAGSPMEAVVLQGATAGAASAVKACYAAWTKGSLALLAAIRALAKHEGVEKPLLEEWRRSQPELAQRCDGISANARKAWRWVGEMEEIAAAFSAADLPPGFHRASAEIYRRLARFKGRSSPPALDEALAALAREERDIESPHA